MSNQRYTGCASFAMGCLCATALASCGQSAAAAEQWHLTKLGIYDTWKWAPTGLRGSGVRVAVLDSGVTCSHPMLCSHMATLDGSKPACGASTPPYCSQGNGFDFQDYDGSADGSDRHGSKYLDHGTEVASLIVGTAPEAKILSVRIGYDGIVNDATLAKAILWAADHGANIINISKTWETEYPETQCAIARVGSRDYGGGRGVLVVAATHALSVPIAYGFPSAYASRGLSNVIAVTDLYKSDSFVYYRRAPAEENLLAAPGWDIPVASSAGGRRTDSGSSLSAPMVASLAADLWSYRPFANLTARQMRCALIEGSKAAGQFAHYFVLNGPAPISTVPIANLAFVIDERSRQAVIARCTASGE